MDRRVIEAEIDKALGLRADATDLGRMLCWWRHDRKLSQRDLERVSGFTRRLIENLEHGLGKVHEGHLATYAQLECMAPIPWLERVLREYRAARARTEREIRKTFGRAKSA